jgi:hypothetical protein
MVEQLRSTQGGNRLEAEGIYRKALVAGNGYPGSNSPANGEIQLDFIAKGDGK